MLDMALIRNTPGIILHNLQRRQDNSVDLDEVLDLDRAVCHLIKEVAELRHQRNMLAKQQSELMLKHRSQSKSTQQVTSDLQAGLVKCNEDIKIEGQRIKQLIQAREKELHVQEQRLRNLLYNIPNIALEQVPDQLQIIRTFGKNKEWNFLPKPHYELLPHLMDFNTAQKISGAKFVVLRQDLALLERALINFLLDHVKQNFYFTEISIPYLVKKEAMYNTGQLPKFYHDQFHTQDDFSLIPTSEVSLMNMIRDCLLEKAALPLRWVAYSPCFRREAGAAGKQTRGLIRQHQFHKVEMVSIVTPELAIAEMEHQVNCVENILRQLGLRYRVVLLPANDLGFTAKITYDIEVYLEGERRYCEISSCSYCGDFQARRLKARYRDFVNANKSINKYVHTLNGSALAVGRLIAALLESYQHMDGSVSIPEVLWPYMNNTCRLV